MIRIEDGTQIWVEDLLSSRSGTGALESDLMHRLAYRLGIGVPMTALGRRGGRLRLRQLGFIAGEEQRQPGNLRRRGRQDR